MTLLKKATSLHPSLRLTLAVTIVFSAAFLSVGAAAAPGADTSGTSGGIMGVMGRFDDAKTAEARAYSQIIRQGDSALSVSCFDEALGLSSRLGAIFSDVPPTNIMPPNGAVFNGGQLYNTYSGLGVRADDIGEPVPNGLAVAYAGVISSTADNLMGGTGGFTLPFPFNKTPAATGTTTLIMPWAGDLGVDANGNPIPDPSDNLQVPIGSSSGGLGGNLVVPRNFSDSLLGRSGMNEFGGVNIYVSALTDYFESPASGVGGSGPPGSSGGNTLGSPNNASYATQMDNEFDILLAGAPPDMSSSGGSSGGVVTDDTGMWYPGMDSSSGGGLPIPTGPGSVAWQIMQAYSSAILTTLEGVMPSADPNNKGFGHDGPISVLQTYLYDFYGDLTTAFNLKVQMYADINGVRMPNQASSGGCVPVAGGGASPPPLSSSSSGGAIAGGIPAPGLAATYAKGVLDPDTGLLFSSETSMSGLSWTDLRAAIGSHSFSSSGSSGSYSSSGSASLSSSSGSSNGRFADYQGCHKIAKLWKGIPMNNVGIVGIKSGGPRNDIPYLTFSDLLTGSREAGSDFNKEVNGGSAKPLEEARQDLTALLRAPNGTPPTQDQLDYQALRTSLGLPATPPNSLSSWNAPPDTRNIPTRNVPAQQAATPNDIINLMP